MFYAPADASARLNEVIDGVVPHKPTSRFAACKTMSAGTVEGLTTNARVERIPRRRDIAIRSEVSSSRVPTDEQGMACRKSN